MSCEKNKNTICRATGPVYGLTSQAGNNVATNIWAAGSFQRISRSPGQPRFVRRWNEYLEQQPNREEIRQILEQTTFFSDIGRNCTRQEFVEKVFARGWPAQTIRFPNDQKRRKEYSIGNRKVLRIEYDYWRYLTGNDTSPWKYYYPGVRGRRFVVLPLEEMETATVVIDTNTRRGHKIDSKGFDCETTRYILRNMNRDTETAEETLDFYSDPLPQMPPASASAASEPHTWILVSTKPGQTTTTPIQSLIDAGLKLENEVLKHSCGGTVHIFMRRVKSYRQLPDKTIQTERLYLPMYRCQKCHQIVITS